MNETTSLKDGDSVSRPGSPAASDIDFGGDGGGIDFEIEEEPAAAAGDDGGLSVDMSSKDDSSLGRAGRRSGLGDLEISGLDENGEESSKSTAESSKSAKKKKRKDAASKKGPKRMKKRRKIVIDNNETELSSDHMKAMLRDTSDIVLQNVPDLAAWPREDGGGGDDDDPYVGICPALQRLPTERLLARPCIGDDGGLAPELLALWKRNTVRVEGKAGTQLPFRMRGARGREQRGAAAERVMEDEARRQLEEEEEDGEVERARSQQQGEEEEGGGEPREDDELDFGGGGDDFNIDEDRAAEDDLETPFDVKDEFGAVEYKNDDLADDDELSQRSDGSNFSLGAVNDLEKELYDVDGDGEDESEERQALGEEAAHTHKWHKHTVRVFGILKRQMRSEDDEEGADEEGEEKPTELSYNKLSSGCSRRTAAGVFFEMLQLKTWDYVEVREFLCCIVPTFDLEGIRSTPSLLFSLTRKRTTATSLSDPVRGSRKTRRTEYVLDYASRGVSSLRISQERFIWRRI